MNAMEGIKARQASITKSLIHIHEKRNEMKRIISTLILLTAVFNMISASSLTQEADSAYMNDDFIKAAKLYEEIAANEGTSSNLFYNLGNAYYRQGKLGLAILNYERALRLDPSNKDARTNLAFVNSKITDEPGDRGMFISNTVNGFACKTPANTWSLIAIGSFVLLLGAIALYVFSSNVRLRKTRVLRRHPAARGMCTGQHNGIHRHTLLHFPQRSDNH